MKYFVLIYCISVALGFGQLRIAKLKYGGGGDWYANESALPNLINFCNQQISTGIAPDGDVVDVGSTDLFLYPYVYMTGHGHFIFTDNEAQNLRKYLLAGGFLHIDDNYGLDPYVRTEMKKVFPGLDFVELPYTHPIYRGRFVFKDGLPKVHEHDGLRPQGFALIYQGRVLCFYSYESDLGNGWEDAEIYNDPPEIRQKALQMGANIIAFVFARSRKVQAKK